MKLDRKRAAICGRVAALLKEERERQGLSLNSLAIKAGVSRQMVSYIEQQLRNPTLETLLRISDALSVNLDEVIKHARLAES